MNSAVGSLENPTRRRARVIDVRLARDADDRCGSITDRTDVPPTYRVGVGLLGLNHSETENNGSKGEQDSCSSMHGHLQSDTSRCVSPRSGRLIIAQDFWLPEHWLFSVVDENWPRRAMLLSRNGTKVNEFLQFRN